MEFVRLTTSGFANSSYWDIIHLHTQIQKFSSILKGLRKYRKKSLFLPFLVVFYQNVTQPHFMHQVLVTLICLEGDWAHQILPPTRWVNHVWLNVDFFLSFALYPEFEELFLWSHQVVSYIKLFRLESSIILSVICIVLDHLLIQIPIKYNEYLLNNCYNCYNYYHIFRE